MIRFSTPSQMAECGGPCYKGPEACDCDVRFLNKTTNLEEAHLQARRLCQNAHIDRNDPVFAIQYKEMQTVPNIPDEVVARFVADILREGACTEGHMQRSIAQRAISWARAQEADPPEDDPWQHRSDHMRCATCMWWVPKGNDLAGIGRCRRHAPTMSGYPVVFDRDWCGDHKLNENALQEDYNCG